MAPLHADRPGGQVGDLILAEGLVDGLHTALLAGAVLAAVGAIASARLLGLGRGDIAVPQVA